MSRQRRSLRHTAATRIGITLLAVAVVAVLVSVVVYQTLLERASRIRSESVMRDYQEKLQETARSWDEFLTREKRRLEYTRLLDNPDGRWDRLHVILNTLTDTPQFAGMTICDSAGRQLFRYGPDAGCRPLAPGSSVAKTYHYFLDSNGLLFLALDSSLWLGPEGSGLMRLIVPLDHGFLWRTAFTGTDLFILWNDRLVASSAGEQGIAVEIQPPGRRYKWDGAYYIQQRIHFPGSGTVPELLIRTRIDLPVSVAESSAIGLGIFVLMGIMILLSLHGWLTRLLPRIESLGQAAAFYKHDENLSSRIEEQLSIAAGENNDELTDAAGAAREMIKALDERNIARLADEVRRRCDEQRIEQLAFRDPLTNLPNRFSLHEMLTQALGLAQRDGRQMAVMLIDLDNFKVINDTLGHPTGDQLLVQVAQRLTETIRQSDFVARLGGDEFVIVLPDINSLTSAAHVAEKVLIRVSEPYLIETLELRTSPSIGISIYPEDATDIENLIRNADVAMYHAKSSGRADYHFFAPEMQAAAVKRLAIEADLRKAIERQEFILHYQPQLDLRTGDIVGVEALVRWQHPSGQLVPPGEFIPIAESSGLIVPIGDWVLQEACRQLAAWQTEGLPHIRMSVNLSASQFADPALAGRIREILAATGIAGDRLDLEVTESMAMKSPATTVNTMQALAALGSSLSIDDFGTGYSSLAYLKLFPIRTLKIDRSFVKDIETDPGDAEICDVVVLLAHKLGLDVVAEGVETDGQLRFLLSIGCECIQGYHISRPLPAADAAVFIRTNPRLTQLGTVDLWNKS